MRMRGSSKGQGKKKRSVSPTQTKGGKERKKGKSNLLGRRGDARAIEGLKEKRGGIKVKISPQQKKRKGRLKETARRS